METENIFNDFIDEEFNKQQSIDYIGKYNQTVFPIIGYLQPSNKRHSQGTGFFINEEGYFITAGHVVQAENQNYKAIVNDAEYDFEIVFKEYVKVEEQDIVCKDLAICKINDIDKTNQSFLSKLIISDSLVVFLGFSQNRLKSLIINPIIVRDLFLQEYHCKDKKLDEPRKVPDRNSYHFDRRPICSNTRSLGLTEGIKYNGFSGSPVYQKDSVCGMLIGCEYIISDYILAKLEALKITI